MVTICPLLTIAEAVAGIAGRDWPDTCYGPKCQWWHKCRRPDQCPKCGAIGEPDDYAKGYVCPASCGWFDSTGDLVEYAKEEGKREDC